MFEDDLACLMGFTSSAAATTGPSAPGATWAPGTVSFSRNWHSGSKGKKSWDGDSRISLGGVVWGNAAGAVYKDELRFDLIDSTNVIENASATSFTETWEAVWDPSKSIQFVFDRGVDLSDLDQVASNMDTTWGDKELFSVSNIKRVQDSMAKSFSDLDKFYKFSMPVVNQGDGNPI